MAFIWDAERIEYMRALHQEGHSDSDMARLLMQKFPGAGILTRNAVIGKRHRLKGMANHDRPRPSPSAGTKLSPSKKQAVRSGAGHAPRKIEERAARIVLNAAPENDFSLDVPGLECKAVEMIDLGTSACRWPLDAGGYCGMLAVIGRPYCSVHCRVAYRNVTESRAAAGRQGFAKNTNPVPF